MIVNYLSIFNLRGTKVYIPFYDDDVGGANAIEETVEAVALDKDGKWSVRDSDGFWHGWLSDAFLTECEAIKEAENEQRKAD